MLNNVLDFTFVVSCFEQANLAWASLGALRRVYPNERIVFFSDGDPHPMLVEIARRLGLEFVAGSRLHLAEHGGRLWQGYLEKFLERPTSHLVKVDCDTKAWRRMTWPAPSDCVCGDLRPCEPEGFMHVQGGCKVIGAEACKVLAGSGVLLDERYKDVSSYCGPERAASLLPTRLGCEDRYMAHACRRSGVPLRRHPEVLSRPFGPPPSNPGLRLAFTHPHKDPSCF